MIHRLEAEARITHDFLKLIPLEYVQSVVKLQRYFETEDGDDEDN